MTYNVFGGTLNPTVLLLLLVLNGCLFRGTVSARLVIGLSQLLVQ